MSTGSAPLAGARLWFAAAVLVVAILAGVASLGMLLEPGPWLARSAVAVAVVAVGTTTLRHTLRSRVAPSAWGVLLALIVVAAGYGGPTAGWSVPSPTLETVERLRLLLGAGLQTVTDEAIPVSTTRGLDLLVVLGAVVCYLAADILVLGMRRAGLAGIPVIALWTPAALFQKQPALLLVAVGLVTYLILLGLTHRRAPHGSARARARTVTTAAAGLSVATLAVATVATALPFYGSQRLPSALGGGPDGISSPLRLSTDLDMRVSLSQRSDEPLLTYVTDGTPPGPLRTHTLTEFDGQRWRRGVSVSDPRSPHGLLWPEDRVPGDADPAALRVQIHRLDQDRLPITVDPRRVDVDGTWLYDPRFDEVMALGSTTTRGLSYDLTFTPRGLTADSLRADRAGELSAGARFLQIPATVHEADIRALVTEITAEEDTDYDRALALQMYLRSATNFTYDTQIPPAESQDAVWEFLERRSGYCVQFATAMTLMARMLGIPARMAIGFLPGEAVPNTPRTFQVTGRQAHAWPELYFAEAGWVRFEPTPARQTGAPPIWADPFAGQPIPEEQFPVGQGQEQDPVTAPPPSSGQPGYLSIGDAEIPVPAAVVALALLVLLGVGLFAHRRLRHRDRRPAGPEEWWAKLRSLCAEDGVTWSDATTPRQAARMLRDAYPIGTAAVEADAALGSLVRAVENTRYAPVRDEWTTEDLEAWVRIAHSPLVEAHRAEAQNEAERLRRVPT